jgi:hypothetical protein
MARHLRARPVAGEKDGQVSAAALPGRWLRRLSVAHAVLGVLIYRRELGDIGSRGFVGAVPYRSERAAALWFVGSALPGWLVGRLVDVAAEAGDADAVREAGVLGLAAGLGGAVLMPVSPFLIQVAVCSEIVRRSHQLGGPVGRSGDVMG